MCDGREAVFRRCRRLRFRRHRHPSIIIPECVAAAAAITTATAATATTTAAATTRIHIQSYLRENAYIYIYIYTSGYLNYGQNSVTTPPFQSTSILNPATIFFVHIDLSRANLRGQLLLNLLLLITTQTNIG